MRVVGVAHDRREHPVDVEQDRAVARIGLQGREELFQCRGGGHGPSMPTIPPSGSPGPKTSRITSLPLGIILKIFTRPDAISVRNAKREVDGEHVDIAFSPHSFTVLEMQLALPRAEMRAAPPRPRAGW